MAFTIAQKQSIKEEIRKILSHEAEITRIVVFGSFLRSENPRDIDIAVFQDSNQEYLPLSLKYRRLTRKLAKMLPMDIIPLRASSSDGFIHEIESGETIYERRD